MFHEFSFRECLILKVDHLVVLAHLCWSSVDVGSFPSMGDKDSLLAPKKNWERDHGELAALDRRARPFKDDGNLAGRQVGFLPWALTGTH